METGQIVSQKKNLGLSCQLRRAVNKIKSLFENKFYSFGLVGSSILVSPKMYRFER